MSSFHEELDGNGVFGIGENEYTSIFYQYDSYLKALTNAFIRHSNSPRTELEWVSSVNTALNQSNNRLLEEIRRLHDKYPEEKLTWPERLDNMTKYEYL